MRPRYVLAPEAALDLVQIWRHIRDNASTETADRVESTIREKIMGLAGSPDSGHSRKDLTDEPVKFFPVYSSPARLPPRDEPVTDRRHSSRSPRLRTTPRESSLSPGEHHNVWRVTASRSMAGNTIRALQGCVCACATPDEAIKSFKSAMPSAARGVSGR